MNYLSVCSGIEAASVAWNPLGWNCVGVSEIEPFPSAVLSHHFPTVKNYGDFTSIPALTGVDLIVGGTPCQSFSVAGLRGGLDDDRGNLALEFMRLVDRIRPRWVVWENVPGVLSSNGGRDFGSILGALAKLGYGFAYRVLDAQFFGVPQRRRRVFLVGCLGDARSAGTVLLEPGCVRGHSPKGRKAGKETAPGPGHGPSLVSGSVAHALACHMVKSGDPTPDNYVLQPIVVGRDAVPEPIVFDTTQITSKTNRSQPGPGRPSHPLAAQGHPPAVCITGAVTHTLRAEGFDASEDGTGRGNPLTTVAHRVRRLTPMECERLQGFPDGWTQVPFKNKPSKDSPRYKALGNSMAVPVMAFIGKRIGELS